jgi:hypothetical protein
MQSDRLKRSRGFYADPEIQSVMEPGGLWWTDVEINKAEYEQKNLAEPSEIDVLIELLREYRKTMDDSLLGHEFPES